MELKRTKNGGGRAFSSWVKVLAIGLASTQIVACSRNIISDSLIASLGHKSGPPKEKICEVGVNGSTCGTAVSGETIWTNEYKVVRSSGASAEKPQEATFEYVTRYEFKTEFTGEPVWKRVLTVKNPAGEVRSMSQGGLVESVTADKVNLIMTEISCDDEAAGLAANVKQIHLFYERIGTSLRLSESKIQKITIRNLGDLLIAPIFGAMTEAISILFREAFSFGNARIHLESGEIRLSLSKPYEAQSLGTLGCFEYGNKFKASK